MLLRLWGANVVREPALTQRAIPIFRTLCNPLEHRGPQPYFRHLSLRGIISGLWTSIIIDWPRQQLFGKQLSLRTMGCGTFAALAFTPTRETRMALDTPRAPESHALTLSLSAIYQHRVASNQSPELGTLVMCLVTYQSSGL